MKPCADMEALMAEALGGELDPRGREALENHLAECAPCREDWSSLSQLADRLATLPDPAPDPGFRGRGLAALEAAVTGNAEPAPDRSRPGVGSDPDGGWRGWVMPFLLGAAAMLLLVGGVALGAGLGPRARPSDPVLAMLQQPSAAQRQAGLMLVRAGEAPGSAPDLVPTLLRLVAQDADTQVRLAAVEALGLFTGSPELRSALVQAVARQDRPEVQGALADLLMAQQQRQGLEALRRLEREGRLQGPARQRMARGGC